jgi:hypothetical protein
MEQGMFRFEHLCKKIESLVKIFKYIFKFMINNPIIKKKMKNSPKVITDELFRKIVI